MLRNILFDSSEIIVYTNYEDYLGLVPSHSDGGGITVYRLSTEVYFKFKSIDFVFTIPIGFLTNLATIPKPLSGIFSHDDIRIIIPSIVHDYLYSMRAWGQRKKSDLIFKRMLSHNKVSSFFTFSIYWILRIFGKTYKDVDDNLVIRMRKLAFLEDPNVNYFI